MKEHTKKIGEGFSGLFHDLRKYTVHISKRLNAFLGRIGWIVVGGVIIVWILLASYLHRVEKARSLPYLYEHDTHPRWTTSLWNNGWIRDMERDMQRMHERMERTRAYYDQLFTTMKSSSRNANYQKYLRSDTSKGTTSLTYNQGKVQGFVQREDQEALFKLIDVLQQKGVIVEKNNNTVTFSGEVKDIQDIITLLQ